MMFLPVLITQFFFACPKNNDYKGLFKRAFFSMYANPNITNPILLRQYVYFFFSIEKKKSYLTSFAIQ